MNFISRYLFIVKYVLSNCSSSGPALLAGSEIQAFYMGLRVFYCDIPG